jgi:FkbH-like protein
VFVDDNPVELAEVSLALPAVRCVAFPVGDDALPRFCHDLSRLFARSTITPEDRERTTLYRRRLEGMAPSTLEGADLSRFLQDLGMKLTIHDRSRGDRTRALQLINKTNQFNLNGIRVSDEELERILSAGGRLYGASLADRTGDHGEILACLIDGGVISALVMSCRVFQRRVEYAFLAWLAGQPHPPTALRWAHTPRNEPFAQFVRELAGSVNGDGLVPLDLPWIRQSYASDERLFSLDLPQLVPAG